MLLDPAPALCDAIGTAPEPSSFRDAEYRARKYRPTAVNGMAFLPRTMHESLTAFLLLPIQQPAIDQPPA